jgi:hypothetical protein
VRAGARDRSAKGDEPHLARRDASREAGLVSDLRRKRARCQGDPDKGGKGGGSSLRPAARASLEARDEKAAAPALLALACLEGSARLERVRDHVVQPLPRCTM